MTRSPSGVWPLTEVQILEDCDVKGALFVEMKIWPRVGEERGAERDEDESKVHAGE